MGSLVVEICFRRSREGLASIREPFRLAVGMSKSEEERGSRPRPFAEALACGGSFYTRPVNSEPLRLRLLNDFEVIVAGLRSMIEPYTDRFRIVEEDVRDTADQPVDLTLYDTFGAAQADQEAIAAVLADPMAGAVVVYSWNMQPALVEKAIGRGCRGYLDKRLSAADVVAALERVGAGETVVQHREQGEADDESLPETEWPGQAAGLSVREAEVIALITQGLTNADIAARAYISMNSLKTNIRSAYRKIGVERRSQAVRWGLEHGMLPQHSDD